MRNLKFLFRTRIPRQPTKRIIQQFPKQTQQRLYLYPLVLIPLFLTTLHAQEQKPNPTTFIADAVDKVIDSVVNITVETTTMQFFKKNTFISSGSGFFIDSDGTILTNAHVVTDMDDGKIMVRASDGYEFEAEVFSLDTRADLAIVKPIHPQRERFKAVQFGSNVKTRPGDWVVAIGCPFGLQNTVTAGVISSRSRHSVEIGARDDRVRFLQTDCVVHSGSSGGPLINLEGKVIGINTTRAESEGISFAIRVDTCLDMIQQLKKEGKVVRPYLGLQMTTLSPNVFHQLKKSFANSVPHVNQGVLLVRVNSGSPAEKAGLQEGDIITQVNSTKITSSQDMLQIIGLGFGKPVHIHIKRNVPLEMDWDGRVIRYETVDYVCKVVPEELDIEIHNVQDNTTTAVGV